MSANIGPAFLALPYDVQLAVLDAMLAQGLIEKAAVVADCTGLGRDLRHHLLVSRTFVRVDAIVDLMEIAALDLVKRFHGDAGLTRVFKWAMEQGRVEFLELAADYVPDGLEFQAPLDPLHFTKIARWANWAGIIPSDCVYDLIHSINCITTLEGLRDHVIGKDAWMNRDNNRVWDFVWHNIIERVTTGNCSAELYKWWNDNEVYVSISTETFEDWWNDGRFDLMLVFLELNVWDDFHPSDFAQRALELPEDCPVRAALLEL